MNPFDVVMDFIDRFEIFVLLAIVIVLIIAWKKIVSKLEQHLRLGELRTVQIEIKDSLEELKQESTSLSKAQIAMIRDRILQAHAFFMKQGHIDYHTYDSLNRMFQIYTERRENGAAARYMAELSKLPKE